MAENSPQTEELVHSGAAVPHQWGLSKPLRTTNTTQTPMLSHFLETQVASRGLRYRKYFRRKCAYNLEVLIFYGGKRSNIEKTDTKPKSVRVTEKELQTVTGCLPTSPRKISLMYVFLQRKIWGIFFGGGWGTKLVYLKKWYK